jgi:translation elongation factor P/translation initiation factor 5A
MKIFQKKFFNSFFNNLKRFYKVPSVKLEKGDYFEHNGKVYIAEEIGHSKKARSANIITVI